MGGKGVVLVPGVSSGASISSSPLFSSSYGGATVGEFPVHLFPRWLRWFFVGVVPAGAVVYLPAMYALDAANPLGVPTWVQVLSPLVCVPVLLAAAAVWRLGLRHYESTGS